MLLTAAVGPFFTFLSKHGCNEDKILYIKQIIFKENPESGASLDYLSLKHKFETAWCFFLWFLKCQF